MKTRLGCITIPALITVVLGLALVGAISFLRGGTLFSPGPLNAQKGLLSVGSIVSHADLSGKCASCHTAPWQSDSMSDRCVACHSDVGQDALNFHNTLSEGDDTCVKCHTEHHGPTAPITIFDSRFFPHELIGFSLTAHQKTINGSAFSCSDCHEEKTSSFDQTVCATCHAQIDASYMVNHVAAFDQDCMGCHDGVDVYGKGKFDHSKVAYPLVGQHASVDCAGCHAGETTPAELKATSQDCSSCHQDQDSHQGVMGRNCAACHTSDGWQASSFDHAQVAYALTGKHVDVACQACHLDENLKSTPQDCFACHIKQDPHQGELGQDCAACHIPDGWTSVSFDHTKTNYPLIGKHSQVNCKSCHQDLLFKNTPQDCISCHSNTDPHQGQLGQDCATCHTPDDWKVSTFNHTNSTYSLVGSHATASCQSCHTDLLYKNTPKDCYSCHGRNDPHQGQLGQNCVSCHTPDGWKNVTFDHSNSKFPLLGKHADANCQSCHNDLLYKNAPLDCAGCHSKDDSHNGELGNSCKACHTPSGWKPSTFDHSQASFQLSGKHIGVNCASCHPGGQYKGIPKNCYGCHAKDDKHGGQYGNDCAACHVPASWSQVSFNHSDTSFPLTGKHKQVNCTNCHTNGQYKGTPKTCNACHVNNDAHNGQFGVDCGACHDTSGWGNATFDHSQSGFPLTGKHKDVKCASCHAGGQYKGTPKNCNACHSQDDKHNGQFGTDCGACHTTSGWGGANFDHSNTSFPLKGKHLNASCSSCHAGGQYKGTPTSCNACHANDDAHGGQYGTNCGTCHDPGGWTPANFNHSGFPLTGAHQGLPCTNCHPNGRFQGTPKACSACHNEPAYHAGLFGNTCDDCHNTSAWKPANYNRSHTFPINHGGSNSCHTCHPSSLSQYTCYSCHDRSEIKNKHEGEGIPNFDNCVQCHADGRQHDGLVMDNQQFVILFGWLDNIWKGHW